MPADPNMKILVVDDMSTMRRIVKNILKQLGFNNLEEAENGQDALTKLKADNYGFVVSDWNMPVMSGIEFLEKLRQMPGGDSPKVVFCTTENDMAHIQRAMTAGANEYIMKPFDADIIQSKFSQIGLIGG